jgi:hypothetical protein
MHYKEIELFKEAYWNLSQLAKTDRDYIKRMAFLISALSICSITATLLGNSIERIYTTLYDNPIVIAIILLISSINIYLVILAKNSWIKFYNVSTQFTKFDYHNLSASDVLLIINLLSDYQSGLTFKAQYYADRLSSIDTLTSIDLSLLNFIELWYNDTQWEIIAVKALIKKMENSK